MKKHFLLLLLICFQLQAQNSSSNAVAGKGTVRADRIQIARDSFGIPHIFAPTDPEVAYGLAWAHAEDDLGSLETMILTGKGKLGKAYGRKGAEADYVVQLLRCRKLVEENYHSLGPEFVRLMKGYIAGLNDFAKAHPEKLKYKFTFPFDEIDYLTAVVFSMSMFCGVDQALPRILGDRVATIPDFNTKGSNAFAFHPSFTSTGEAFLAINAHQPLEGPMAFYEAHLNSEEGWNILGGLLPGGAMIFHGVNEHLGWAHTNNYMDKIDIYQLKMHPSKKDYYEFDGSWIKLERNKARLKVKGVPIALRKKIWWSKYGATVKTGKGYFSLRLGANMEIRELENWYKMNKAKNFTEFYEAIKMNALSMFNITYADRYDTIFYISNGKMPYRPLGYDWSSTLPGNTSATLWTKFKPVTVFPQYLNPGSGYLFNTNHSPFLATDPKYNLDSTKFDSNDGYETYHNNRSQRVMELMEGSTKIDYPTFKRIKFDQQLPRDLKYRYGIDTLLSLKADEYPQLKPLVEILQQWDRKAVMNSNGAAVFLLLYHKVVAKLGLSAPRQLTKQESVETLQAVYDHLMKYFGRTDVTLGEIQKIKRGNELIPTWGLPDVLTPTYCLPIENGLFKVDFGEAYICLVRFPKNALPIIESINTFGASMDPASPHYKDQLARWQAQQPKRMTLDKQEVLKNAVRIYHPQ